MAVERDHLEHAPLREALIDIQFEPLVPLESVDEFVATLEGTFRTKGTLYVAHWDLAATDEGLDAKSVPKREIAGRRIEGINSQPYVLQVRADGFTVSRLTPYTKWAELKGTAKYLWDRFRVHADVKLVNRLAVRYINELKLPLPIMDFGEYLTAPPQVPDSMPQGINGFLSRVSIPVEECGCQAIITQVMDAPAADGLDITVILDIDVFRKSNIDPRQDDKLWRHIDVLHGIKNKAFFGHLTEKAVELFV